MTIRVPPSSGRVGGPDSLRGPDKPRLPKSGEPRPASSSPAASVSRSATAQFISGLQGSTSSEIRADVVEETRRQLELPPGHPDGLEQYEDAAVDGLMADFFGARFGPAV